MPYQLRVEPFFPEDHDRPCKHRSCFYQCWTVLEKIAQRVKISRRKSYKNYIHINPKVTCLRRIFLFVQNNKKKWLKKANFSLFSRIKYWLKINASKTTNLFYSVHGPCYCLERSLQLSKFPNLCISLGCKW